MKECMEVLGKLSGDHSYESIFRIMCEFGGKVAAEYSDDGGNIVKITYAEYEKRVRAAAAALSKKLGGHDAVGIKLANGPDWPVMYWAAMMSGHMPVLLDAAGEKQTIEHLLKQAGAKAVITDDLVSYDGYETIDAAGLKNGGEDADYEPSWADATCLCTSGTTGTSRVFLYDGEAMSHQMLNAKYFIREGLDLMYDTSEGEVKNLAFLPLHHIFGFVAVYMWYSFFGKTIVYLKDRNPATIMGTCKEHGVTHIFCVPMFWNSVSQGIDRKVKKGGEKQERLFERMSRISFMIQSRMKNKGRSLVANSFFKGVQNELVGGTIRYMITGGGHILPESMRTINRIGYPLFNGFGMTETGITSVDMTNDISKRIQASVGKPFKSIEYRIDAKEGEEIGELLINGDSLHTGQMIDGQFHKRNRDEWFRTGDIARIGEDGSLWLEGRLKEVIINESGENVYPDELEDYFVNLPGVSKLCIAGIDFGGSYETTTMVLELEDDVDDDGIFELCECIDDINKALPMTKQIARVLVSERPLPLANGIKVKRQKLKAFIEAGEWKCGTLDMKNYVLEGGKMPDSSGKEHEITDEYYHEIKETVRSIIADVLILDENEVGDDDHFVMDLGGDSLSVIGVITQLEERYSLMIPDSDFSRATTVDEITKLIYEKLTGIETEQKEQAMPTVRRVTDFAETEEYAALLLRQTDADMEGANPYFVAHDSVIRDTSVVNGREVINLGSYNYIGMSGNKETEKAAISAVKKYGTSASGSRVLAGEKTMYQELEETIARWKHTEAALVMTGGYATNQSFISEFCNESDLILYDALSHHSITAGCQASRSKSKAFPHNDIETLENILKTIDGKYRKVLLVVEGVYSMDGDIAPIPEFVRLKKEYGCFLMVDEAHSSGVIGPHGGGVDDHFGLAPDDIDIKMGTLSKALGTCGGYIAAKRCIIDYLKYSLSGFVFTAGISPPLAAAAKRAIELLQEDSSIVRRLHKNIAFFIEGAQALGLNTINAKESAIVPIFIGTDKMAFQASHMLLERGVFVPPAVYPAVAPGSSRLRFSITSEHTEKQLKKALSALEEVARELLLIK